LLSQWQHNDLDMLYARLTQAVLRQSSFIIDCTLCCYYFPDAAVINDIPSNHHIFAVGCELPF
jgi:Pyruvate/2-oxoacid:ferredoxin oxidoreductase delta subunit